MTIITFHYPNTPTGLYLCERASSRDKQPCEEAFGVLVEGSPPWKGQEWAVMIPDLVTLEAFIEKYGECIINRKGIPSITIYDDYVE